MSLPELPPGDLAATREGLRRVGAHALARRRQSVTGRIGLRAAPGGIATPAFGEGPERVRTSADLLVHESGDRVRVARLTTLRAAAELVGVDLDAPLSVGHDTPPVGDPDAPLAIAPEVARALGDWFGLVAEALDEVAAGLDGAAGPSTAQLWPEHFDLALHAGWGPGENDRANLGGGAGDAFEADPYAYVGPWGPQRPGDPSYWNAPFGAVLPYARVREERGRDGERALLVSFFRRGLELLAGR